MKVKYLILAILLSAGRLFAADNNLPRVYLQPPAVESDNVQLKTVSNTVFDTTHLILDQMARYQIMTNGTESIEDPAAFCREHNVDTLIGGECRFGDEGEWVISLYVYDREEATIKDRESRRAESALEVFDLVDEMVVQLLQKFSGRHIAFGSVELENTGTAGTYSLLMDGKALAVKEGRVEKLLYGAHTMEIRQDRMNGEYSVVTRELEIPEDGTAVFSFSLPGILEEEETLLTEEEAYIRKYWEKKRKRDEVEEAFGRLEAMTADVSYSAAMAQRRSDIEDMKAEWEAYWGEKLAPADSRKGLNYFSLGVGYENMMISIEESQFIDGIESELLWETFPLSISYTRFLTDHSCITFELDYHAGNMGFLVGDYDVNGDSSLDVDENNVDLAEIRNSFGINAYYEYHFNHLFLSIGLGYLISVDCDHKEFLGGNSFASYTSSLRPGAGFIFNRNGHFQYKIYGQALLEYTDMTSGYSGIQFGPRAGAAVIYSFR